MSSDLAFILLLLLFSCNPYQPNPIAPRFLIVFCSLLSYDPIKNLMLKDLLLQNILVFLQKRYMNGSHLCKQRSKNWEKYYSDISVDLFVINTVILITVVFFFLMMLRHRLILILAQILSFLNVWIVWLIILTDISWFIASITMILLRFSKNLSKQK